MNVAVPSPSSPSVPPPASQLSRIETYRNTIHDRMVEARNAADYLRDCYQTTADTPFTAEEADAVELKLLRLLMDSTRPNPVHLAARL